MLIFSFLMRCALFMLTRCVHTMAVNSQGHNLYNLKSLKLGAEVRGLNLQSEQPADVIAQIKDDVIKHRILVFRDQGIISGDRHAQISRWFGELESTFYKHPRSPHPDVFRVSNDRREGCTGVGRTGWHVDGSFQPSPFAFSLYHIISVPEKGDTVFAPLTEIINGLSPEKRARWERLYMVSDARVNRFHPLIYPHYMTKKPVLCFHLGMTEAFIWDKGTSDERWTDEMETYQILKEIHKEIVKDNGAIQYSHKWQPGDFIISDNTALGHEASPDTQLPPSQVGLRIMHRTTIKGTVPPAKVYEPLSSKEEL